MSATNNNDEIIPSAPAAQTLSYGFLKEHSERKARSHIQTLHAAGFKVVVECDADEALYFKVSNGQSQEKTTTLTKQQLQELGTKRVFTTYLFINLTKVFKAMELAQASLVDETDKTLQVKFVYNFGAANVEDIAPCSIFTIDKPEKVTETFVRVTNLPPFVEQ